MTLNLQNCLTRLTTNTDLINALVHDVSDAQARWQPTADEWSMLEVINHLYDEEREDFPLRLDLILHHPNQTWPPIHPTRWVTEREYNARDRTLSLGNFLRERRDSLQWLAGLKVDDWDVSARHPDGFVLRAGDMLSAWVAHDHLHIRQLNDLHYQFWTQAVAPYDIRYAGDW